MELPKFLLSKTLPSGEVPRRRVLERKPIVAIKLSKMGEKKKKKKFCGNQVAEVIGEGEWEERK